LLLPLGSILLLPLGSILLLPLGSILLLPLGSILLLPLGSILLLPLGSILLLPLGSILLLPLGSILLLPLGSILLLPLGSILLLPLGSILLLPLGSSLKSHSLPLRITPKFCLEGLLANLPFSQLDDCLFEPLPLGLEILKIHPLLIQDQPLEFSQEAMISSIQGLFLSLTQVMAPQKIIPLPHCIPGFDSIFEDHFRPQSHFLFR
jgi:hypothetical protein